jgi:hypothetical protein
LKKRSRPAAKKAGKKKRKPIMRHSREGVRSRKPKRSTRPKRSSKTKKTAKPRSGASKAKSGAKPARPKQTVREQLPKLIRRRRGEEELSLESLSEDRGMEALSGIQSGDMEGLSRLEDADSESVEELLEEGQAFEAGVISGVEEADGTPGEVRTREVPVDDVPQEYLDED